MRRKAVTCSCETVPHDVIEKVDRAMLPASEVNGLSAIFKIIGDPTRIRIMWALNESELCGCELAAVLGTTRSAVSHQLRTLRDAKLVKFRREGKNVYYSLDDQHVTDIVRLALAHLNHE
ncbi:ArsR/SmtB family transcription factor [Methanomassiliicoccus luminyensis]|uniref:ArsR/SmtB family transcription factor n=1 Tax=Methanomassiliicoccus luminyensis TaxID=1080712 RepID=UPI00037BAE9F|nr:metalloregulator ArsR/SmtB family transcription factor [Methanomassiliicoccus luminyensis]